MSFAGAKPLLADGAAVGVPLDVHRDVVTVLEHLPKRNVDPAFEVPRAEDVARMVDRAGHGHAQGLQARAPARNVLDLLVEQPKDGSDPFFGGSLDLVGVDGLFAAYLPGEHGDLAAADVHTEEIAGGSHVFLRQCTTPLWSATPRFTSRSIAATSGAPLGFPIRRARVRSSARGTSSAGGVDVVGFATFGR